MWIVMHVCSIKFMNGNLCVPLSQPRRIDYTFFLRFEPQYWSESSEIIDLH